MTETAHRFRPPGIDFNTFTAKHFLWQLDGKVATITLNRPERKNPLTFESYAELRDTFRYLTYADEVKVVVVTGAGGNFCSGGDVHEIIGPLVEMQRNDDMSTQTPGGWLQFNPEGCWNWFGYGYDRDYLFKSGVQITALYRMVERVTGKEP